MSRRAPTLRELIADQGVAVSAFCREHDFARNTVQQWLTGVRRPYDHNRVRLAKALGITTDKLDAALDATAREAGKP